MHLPLALLWALIAGAADTTLRTEPVADVARDLASFIPRLLDRDRIPGLAIALIRDRRVAWEGGFGVANAWTRQPVDAGTVFPAASLGKPAAAHTALRLVDRGRLALDTPLAAGLPTRWLGDTSPVTLRQVLAHTSGLSNFLGDRDRVPRFTPGERFAYSGVGFMYLQHMLETIEGRPLDSVVAQETFRPLGMTSSWYGRGPEDHRSATGHIPLSRAVAPFGIVFLPLLLLLLVLASAAHRAARGRWRPGRTWIVVATGIAAACTAAFLYRKAASPSLVPYFVLVFAGYALVCAVVARLVVRRAVPRLAVAAALAVGGLVLAGRTPLPIPDGSPPGGNAASSLKATAGDLARLTIELGRPTLLDTVTARELLTEQARAAEHLAWGLGIGLQRAPGANAVFHWGSNPSARGAMVYYPDAGVGAVVLANSGTAGDAVAEVALRAVGGPAYWVDE